MNAQEHIYKPANAQPDALAADLKPLWLEHLTKATCASSGLASLTVPDRERVLGEWFKQGDLGFIFGPRGLGKTWLALLLARRIAEGGCVASKAGSPVHAAKTWSE